MLIALPSSQATSGHDGTVSCWLHAARSRWLPAGSGHLAEGGGLRGLEGAFAKGGGALVNTKGDLERCARISVRIDYLTDVSQDLELDTVFWLAEGQVVVLVCLAACTVREVGLRACSVALGAASCCRSQSPSRRTRVHNVSGSLICWLASKEPCPRLVWPVSLTTVSSFRSQTCSPVGGGPHLQQDDTHLGLLKGPTLFAHNWMGSPTS